MDRERILSQLLLLQGALHVMPTVERLIEFAERATQSVPGVASVHICTAGRPRPPHESLAAICDVCGIGKDCSGTIIQASCGLKGRPLLRSFLLRTQRGSYGYLNLVIDDGESFAPYPQHLENVANTLAISIENMAYKRQIEKANQSLRQEVAERKRTEETLRESEEQLRASMDNAPDGVYLSDLAGNFFYGNRKAEEMIGYRHEEIIGKNMMELNLLPPDGLAKAAELLQDNIRGISTGPDELTLKKKDGNHIIVEINTSLVRHHGQPAVLGFVRDITERKKTEDKIKALLREKELLLKEVHHRIKNNMSSMMSLLSLQSHALKNPEAVAALLEARDRLRSMEVLYDKLYRTENLREMSIKDYLPPLVDEIVGVFPNGGMVKIEKRIDDIVLGVNVLSPLGIIVNELITNALKHAFTGREDGSISVSASAKDDHVILIIEDNGKGIPESVDIANSSGFGLQLVGMLTAQLDGTVRIERRKGTRFVLEFDA
jgi:PAS domain S-box-containing protein